MNDLIPLHFENFDVRMIVRDGVPWWVGIDSTKMLGIVGGHQALRRLEDYERGICNIYTPSGEQEMIIINESGMYSLILKSRKPLAKEFKRWLTTEVLPCIRQHGQYPAPALTVEHEDLPLPDEFDGSYLTSQGTRFFKECRRVLGTTDVKKIAETMSGTRTISPNMVRAIETGGSVTEAIEKSGELWRLLTGLGFDHRYIFEGIWLFTPFERGFIDHLRTLPPQHQARLLSSVTRQIAALDQAGEIHLLN